MSDETPVSPARAQLGIARRPDSASTEAVMRGVKGERDPHLSGGPGARVVSVEQFLRYRGSAEMPTEPEADQR